MIWQVSFSAILPPRVRPLLGKCGNWGKFDWSLVSIVYEVLQQLHNSDELPDIK